MKVLSNNPFNLSQTVEDTSLILSKITHPPFSIALTRNPDSNFKTSLSPPLFFSFLDSSFFFLDSLLFFFFLFSVLIFGIVIPIKSSHCNFFEQIQRYDL